MTTREVTLGFAIGLAATSVLACKSDAASSKEKKDDDLDPAKLAGVWPDRFKCDTVVTDDVLGGVLGGKVKQTDNPVQMTKGLAAPCKYEVLDAAGSLEQWSFDFDCRDNYKTTADAIIAEFTQKNLELVAEWNKQSDAGAIKPNDAGIVNKAPSPPADVQVGAKGKDLMGNALVFIDDDAPCYVRVSGLDPDKRLALGKLLAKQLTFMNAPMTPRKPQ